MNKEVLQLIETSVKRLKQNITEAECEKDGKKLRGYDGKTYSRFVYKIFDHFT